MKQSLQTSLILTALLILAGSAFFASMIIMPGKNPAGDLPSLTADQQQSANAMREVVETLATEIGERHHEVPAAYQQAADYIHAAFKRNGLTPYTEIFGDKEQYRNIVAEHYGREIPDQVIVVGAHYDTVWMTPGADDNASGVAVMLELAKKIANMSLKRSVRFVAFANEEYPFFFTRDMGSLHHARQASERGENIQAMFSLEMLGYYSDEPESQNYPKPFKWLYPDTANFVAFVSNYKSRGLLLDSIKLFRDSGQFPAEGMAAPVMLVRDVRRSDQAAFWRYGYPALMITDTAGFRNFGYHNVSDVPASLNYEHMARVMTGLLELLVSLANR